MQWIREDGEHRRWLVPALLVVVGVVQVALAEGGAVSRWRGGGFGMYADHHPNAHRVWLVDEHGARAIERADSAACDAVQASRRCQRRTTEACLVELARCLRAGRGRLEIWSPRFDPATGLLSRERVAVLVR